MKVNTVVSRQKQIVVDVNHPAHVHFFKYFIVEMRERGHEVLITASDKDVTIHLLNAMGLILSTWELMGTRSCER